MSSMYQHCINDKPESKKNSQGVPMRALFIGSYPNPVEPHKSVFFRELIYQMAKQGVECMVITPVSLSKYRSSMKNIPIYSSEKISEEICIEVFRPRTVSFSAKKIGGWNTIKMTLAVA